MLADSAESTSARFKRAICANDRVLDIGTKDGEKLRDVAGSVVGIDINRETMASSDAPVKFAVGDATRLPFASNSFDYVHCDQVLEHLPETGRVVAEAARVLRPDGLAYVAFPNRLSMRQPHSLLPRYYSLLPRPVGVAVAPYLLDETGAEYYERAVFPLSPVAARRHVHRHFDTVQYPMRMDPRPRADSVRRQELIWWANTAVKHSPLKWPGELLWPASNYLLADPKQASDGGQG